MAAAEQAVAELAKVVSALEQAKRPEQVELLFDLSTVNDTNYYSGLILQGFIEGLPQALLFGGRYDGLLKTLGKSQQAIGFGIHLDLLDQNSQEQAKEQSAWLNVALPKGRMGQSIYELFRDAGLAGANLLDDSRKLVFEDSEKKIRFFLVKPSDVASYVEHGAADIGIVGRDILLETKADVIDLLRFELGKCRIAVAGPANFQGDSTRPLRVATKYPNITRKYFGSRSQPVDLIYLNGSIELAPIVGLADVIVDIVETGNTLRENNLTILEEIDVSSARFIVNRSSWRFKKSAIIEVLEKVSEDK
ncbi:ATP phosphoribosyltransferase [Enterococcus asini]|uniref:ATP phosphoribosyltransferase n=1 Tax=Enterococcus asini TaxID=57732 RepID=UPI00216B6094|nr:ATP phosphoribosyltransferase [Enterococcus asini]